MTSVFKLREIQLGIIILIVLYFAFMVSGVDLFLKYEHPIIIETTLLMLVCLLINLRITVDAPHRGQLVITHKEDTWFINSYKMLFFILFFTVFTLFNALIAHTVPFNRSHDIFLLSLYVANIYYLVLSLWTCYNFIQMSTIGDNMEYKDNF